MMLQPYYWRNVLIITPIIGTTVATICFVLRLLCRYTVKHKLRVEDLVSDTDVPGTWGDDQLIANNNSWLVEIPPTIAPGYYVLRHEIIALHSAESADGAQNYPQCFNLQVTGSGTASPAGVLGTKLYTEKEAGILVNIYSSLSTYVVPGPTIYSGAVSVSQSSSSVTATGRPTTGTDGTSASTESSAEASSK